MLEKPVGMLGKLTSVYEIKHVRLDFETKVEARKLGGDLSRR